MNDTYEYLQLSDDKMTHDNHDPSVFQLSPVVVWI